MILEYLTTTVQLVLTLILLWILKYSYSIHSANKKYSHIPGTNPSGIFGFFLGDIPAIREHDSRGISMHEYLANLVSVHGKTFRFRILNRVLVFTIEPKLVKEIYVDENMPKSEIMYKNVGYPGGVRFLGNGLVTEANHEKWKNRRALFNPGFHRQVLMTFMTEFNSKADILVDYLKTKADGKTELILLDEFNHTALDIIASVAFSMKLDTVNNPDNKFNEYIFFALSNLKSFFMDPFMKFKPWKRGFLAKHKHAIEYLRETGRNQVLERLEMIKKNRELPNDILTTILKSHEDHEFELESMVDDFVTFFVAGQETTATLLSSLFLELGQYPVALETLKSEIDSVLGTKSEITFDDLNDLKYTGLCIKEALRLWPPAPNLQRYCNKDVESENFSIPEGIHIMTSMYASGRCPEFFENPNEFKPERFIMSDSEADNFVSKYVFYPFSLGPRNCIGQNFAQIEAKVIIAKFIQNFDFKLNPNQSFAALAAGTLRPKDGTKCYLTLRV